MTEVEGALEGAPLEGALETKDAPFASAKAAWTAYDLTPGAGLINSVPIQSSETLPTPAVTLVSNALAARTILIIVFWSLLSQLYVIMPLKPLVPGSSFAENFGYLVFYFAGLLPP